MPWLLLTANKWINDVLSTYKAANTDGSLSVLSHTTSTFPCVHHQQIFLTGFSLLSWSRPRGPNLSPHQCPANVWCEPHNFPRYSLRFLMRVSAAIWHWWHEDALFSSVSDHCYHCSTPPFLCRFSGWISLCLHLRERVDQGRLSSCRLSHLQPLPLGSQPVVLQAAVASHSCLCRPQSIGMASLSRPQLCRAWFLPFAPSVQLGLAPRPIDQCRFHLPIWWALMQVTPSEAQPETLRDLGHDFSLGFPPADSLYVGHEAWSIVISPVRVLVGLLCIVVPTFFASVRFCAASASQCWLPLSPTSALDPFCEPFPPAPIPALVLSSFVGVVVRGFPPLCRFSRPSDWGRWCACGKRQVRKQQRVRHVQTRWRILFKRAKMTLQSVWLEPSACGAFRACEQTVLHRCVLWVGVLSTLPVGFLEFLPGNRNHHHFSDDVGSHELQLVCHCEVGHCEVEDEDAAGAFPRGSLQYRHPVYRSYLFLRIADFVVDAVDVVDASVSEIAAFPPGEHLAFSGITYTHCIIVSPLIFLLHNVFLVFLNLRRSLQLNLRMIFCHRFCTNLPKLRGYWADLQKSPCGKHLDVSFMIVELDGLFAMFFSV